MRLPGRKRARKQLPPEFDEGVLGQCLSAAPRSVLSLPDFAHRPFVSDSLACALSSSSFPCTSTFSMHYMIFENMLLTRNCDRRLDTPHSHRLVSGPMTRKNGEHYGSLHSHEGPGDRTSVV